MITGEYEIFKDKGLWGLRKGVIIIIPPTYVEFYPFRYGLACVRNKKFQYSYINVQNEPLFPFGKYIWIDTEFTAGYARAKLNDNLHWTILDLTGEEVVKAGFTNIYSLNIDVLPWVKVFINEWEFKLDLSRIRPVLVGLNYIVTYELQDFKDLYGVDKVQVRLDDKGKPFFTYGSNLGEVGGKGVPSSPVISIVKNCIGRVFLLLHDRADTGREHYFLNQSLLPKTNYPVNDSSASYEDEQQYLEDSYLDAFEGDESNYWNID